MPLPILFQRRVMAWPTLAGWLILGSLFTTPLILWALFGESLLCQTSRKPASILIVEGWIDTPGLRAAAIEFQTGGYEMVIATGGFSAERGNSARWGNYADVAARELLLAGVPEHKIIRAPAEYSENQRTFSAARAVQSCLRIDQSEKKPTFINLFTHGAHGRRTRSVYEKVLGDRFDIGVIAWTKYDYTTKPWWKSSERTKELIVETAGWLFELLLNSGRGWHQSEIHASLNTAAKAQ